MRTLPIAIAGLLSVVGFAGSPRADDAFYDGKSVRLLLSAGNGGGYASYGRALAHHMGNHIPGKPSLVVQSMPGGGGLRATNYLYAQAPKDGTTIGLIHATVILAPLYGTKAAQFDPREFNWLGSMNNAGGICVAWKDSPIKTWDDMMTKEFIVGGSGAGSQMEVLPAMLNKLFGTKIRIISGYKDGTEVFLAMQRGEVHGRCGGIVTAIKATRPDWLTEKKIVVPVAIASERNPEFPDAPSVMEFVKDDHTRRVLQLVFVPQEIERPFLAPPGVPAERVALLRAAFEATMKDPAFAAEAQATRLEVGYVGAEELSQIIQRAYAMPADVVESAKQAVGNQGEAAGGAD
jgi:tripartite-type tricarboxylate transporter receptor subunit TctC